MPVQGKNGLAGALLANDLATPDSGVKSEDHKDADKVDFGAALSSLMAIIAPNQVQPGQTARSVAAVGSATSNSAPRGLAGNKTDIPLAFSNGSLGAERASYEPAPAYAVLGDIPAASAYPQQTASVDPSVRAGATASFADHQPLPPGVTSAVAAPAAVAATTAGNNEASLPIANVSVSVNVPDQVRQIPETGGLVRPLISKGSMMAARTTIDAGAPSEPQHSSSAGERSSSSDAAGQDATKMTGGASRATDASSNSTGTANYTLRASQSEAAVKQPAGLRRAADSGIANVEPASTGKPVVQVQAPEPAAGHDHPTVNRDAKTAGETAQTAQGVFSDETSVEHAPAAVAVRHLQESATPVPAAKVASLRVELSDGKSAQATVRERAGAVEVKIVAATSQSARHISNEVEGLRQALDSAGLKLAQAEVSYQQPQGQGGRDRGDSHREPQRRPAGSNEFFILDEVNE